MPPKTLITCAVIFFALAPGLSHSKEYSLHRRDIGCAEMEAGRGRQICEAISQSLTWQWMGHAVIAPGYKPDSGSLANVHCRLKIGKDDLDALQRLTQSHDWRLQVGAEMLLRMATDGDGKTGEPENSMSDPASAGSGLGKGCGR